MAMRVLMVSTEYPPMRGGVGRYTANLTKALIDSGINEPQERPGGKNGINNKVEIQVVCDEKGGGKFSGIHPRNSQNSQVLLKLVEREKPDIVHVQFEPGLYGLELALTGSRMGITNLDAFYLECPIPIVTTFHSVYTLRQWMDQTSIVKKSGRTGAFGVPARAAIRLWNHFINYKAFINLNKHKLQQSKAAIAFSRDMFTLLGAGKRNEIIYHGAEPSSKVSLSREENRSYFSLHTPSSTSINGIPRIALAIGFETPLKGWDIIQKMSIPDGWTVVINSSRGYYSTESLDLKFNRASQNLAKRRIIDLGKGFLSDDDLSRLFYASDAVLLPYKITSGSGVMFDALAHGLPFVATDLDFFREFSNQGLGITVKRKPSEFVRGLKLLCDNYDHYKTTVNKFKVKLKWNQVAAEHIKVYDRVIKEAKISE
jgi:glycosyltransferase involved in cell wall biosynthesis